MPEAPGPLWLTWEDHRRSRELAAAFDAVYRPLLSRRPYLWRALQLGLRSLRLIARTRPSCLFVQNPSIALTTLACALKPAFRYQLVVDRHSNFKLATLSSRSPEMRLFHLLSRWTVRKADLTIVTNDTLRKLVEEWGGRACVLPDRLPALEAPAPPRATPGRSLTAVFVAGYGPDEPLPAVAEAARLLKGKASILVTGDYRRGGVDPSRWPALQFTGFLSEQEYVKLLSDCDVVIALTREDLILNCAGYEAVALGKPLVLSDTPTLRAYFREAAHYVRDDPAALAAAIEAVGRDPDGRSAQVRQLREVMAREWVMRFGEVRARLGLRDSHATRDIHSGGGTGIDRPPSQGSSAATDS